MSDLSVDHIYGLAMQLDANDRRELAERLQNAPSGLTSADVLAGLDALAERLTALGVVRIGVFGSYARDAARMDSDIDILVELNSKSFAAFMDVKLLLEDYFGRTVNLVLASGLKPGLREQVLGEVKGYSI